MAGGGLGLWLPLVLASGLPGSGSLGSERGHNALYRPVTGGHSGGVSRPPGGLRKAQGGLKAGQGGNEGGLGGQGGLRRMEQAQKFGSFAGLWRHLGKGRVQKK